MSEFNDPSNWEEAVFRDAAYFIIRTFQTVDGRMIKNKARTDDWAEARKAATVCMMLGRKVVVTCISKHEQASLIPAARWEEFDRIWREGHGQT